jgi:hypothetical protein
VLEPTVTDPTATTGQLRVGVAGAGPWSHLFHAPMLASHPLTTLSAVWARRHSAAEEVAGPYGAVAHDSFDRFLDDVDAVAFAVPPDIQAALAPRAAPVTRATLPSREPLTSAADSEGDALMAAR